jgi:hypothetical protein
MEDFGEFLGQIPPILPILFCSFTLLMLISLAIMVANRTRKNAASSAERRREKANWLSSAGSSEPSGVSPATSGELPDLDLLLGGAMPSYTPPPAPTASRPGGTHRLTLSDGSSVEAADVLVIARDLADGSLIVQLGNKAYPLGRYIDDADARRRFTGTLRDLLAHGEAMSAAPPEPVHSAPEPVLEDFAQAAAPEIEAPAEETKPVDLKPEPDTTPRSSTSVPTVPHGTLPGDLPKFVAEDSPLKMRGGMPKNPVPEINIGGAVEAYLQYKLSQTPEFARRSIHIHPTYGGGIRIEVDGRSYEAVDEIDDEATRDFITEAIQEWQARQ